MLIMFVFSVTKKLRIETTYYFGVRLQELFGLASNHPLPFPRIVFMTLIARAIFGFISGGEIKIIWQSFGSMYSILSSIFRSIEIRCCGRVASPMLKVWLKQLICRCKNAFNLLNLLIGLRLKFKSHIILLIANLLLWTLSL